MIFLRQLSSLLIFSVAVIVCLDFVIKGLLLSQLAIMIVCFFIAYYLWPSKRKRQRQQQSQFIDLLEILIELPVDILLWPFRLLKRLLGIADGKASDVDISLDT